MTTKNIAVISISAVMIVALLLLSRVMNGFVFAGDGLTRTHSIWTKDSGTSSVNDAQTGCYYTSFENFQTIISWTEDSSLYPAIAHFRGVAAAKGYPSCAGHNYEFRLLKATYTDQKTIEGVWNVYRDGSLMCSICNGTAYGLDLSVGSDYFVEVQDDTHASTWQYLGNSDHRFTF